MITVLYLSQFVWPVFWLSFVAVALFITLAILNLIRLTLKVLALDVAQVINYIKIDAIERQQKIAGFEISCQVARQRIQANRKMLQSGQAGLLAADWKAGRFDVEIEEVKR
jgi:hypothetical protein